MRVRIIKDPLEEYVWWIQTKYWWEFRWTDRKCFVGQYPKERALETANALLNPEIIEVNR